MPKIMEGSRNFVAFFNTITSLLSLLRVIIIVYSTCISRTEKIIRKNKKIKNKKLKKWKIYYYILNRRCCVAREDAEGNNLNVRV